MVIETLIHFIKTELKERFLQEDLKELKSVLIKEIYEENPKIKYPAITIQEFENEEDTRYSTNLGEEFSSMGYQINFLARNISSMQANEVVRTMSKITNEILGEKYKMVRGAISPITPLPSDSTVLQLSVRYTCIYDIKRNIIYKD